MLVPGGRAEVRTALYAQSLQEKMSFMATSALPNYGAYSADDRANETEIVTSNML